MPYWYEVFDNVEVQLVTRRQAAAVTAVVGATLAATALGLALAHARTLPLPALGAALLVLWTVALRWLAGRVGRLRRVVWCVKISDRQVVGYDYTRKKTVLDWTKIERVELTPTGLVLSSDGVNLLEIPYLFPDFAELSHRIVQHAEFYGVPVFIDGHPWEEIDIYHLFPFIEDGASPAPPAG